MTVVGSAVWLTLATALCPTYIACVELCSMVAEYMASSEHTVAHTQQTRNVRSSSNSDDDAVAATGETLYN